MKRTILTIILTFFLTFTSALTYAGVIGKITAIEGDVDVLKPGMERAAPAILQQSVSERDIVRTKSNGKAEITFVDESIIRLAPGSRLQITEYLMEGNKRKSGVMNLFRGKVRAIVSKSRGFLGVAFGDRERFEVRTPTAVAGVKGTDFFVFYNMGVTGIVVTDGNVDVFNPQIPNQIIPVSEGNATFVLGNALPSAPRPSADVEVIRHTNDTDLGEKPKEQKNEPSAITASVDALSVEGTFGYKAPEGEIAPPPTDTETIAETPVEITISEPHTELLSKSHPELLSDIIPPVISIAGPAAITNSPIANFGFSFSEPVTVTYTLDGAVVASPSLSGLSEGSHLFIVTATDTAGNTSTKTYSWTTDYTAPASLTLSGTPASITNINNATIGATATDANGVKYSYTLDGMPSTNTLTALTEGAHTFKVTATDAAGNTSTKTYSWTTDYTAPVVSIVPAALPDTGVELTKIGISLSSSESSTYSYSLDGGAWTAAAASFNLTGLAEGSHILAYKATDPAGNTATNSLSFDLSRYSLVGNVAASAPIGTVTSGEVAGVSNQTWGGWSISMGGLTGGGAPPSAFTLAAGGGSTDTLASNNGGYWIDIINSTSDGISALSGASTLTYLSYDRLGTGAGAMTGSFDGLGNWSATDVSAGAYTETPLAWSGKVTADNNSNWAYTGAGLYSLDIWGWLDIEGNSTGLMGGTTAPWTGAPSLTFMGTYDVAKGIAVGPPYLWTPEIIIWGSATNNWAGIDTSTGGYQGFIGGAWNSDGTINALVYSLYVDPSGNAGILKGSLAGNYYPTINMFKADGTWTPTALTTGLDVNTTIVNIVFANYGYNITSSGDFNGAGSIAVAGDEMLSNDTWRYSISGQNWGVWKTIIGGDYLGTPSDIWTLYTNWVDVFAGQAMGTNTIGALWSGNKIEGKTFAYGADITTTPNTWISVGEIIGTFDPINFTWQAVQMGAWVDTNKFLAMVAANDTATLTALNIPFAEVGRANLSGSGNNMTVNMNDVIFFAYQTGAAPKIWATGNVNGTYTAPPVINTPVALTGNGLTTAFTPKAWDAVNNKWLSTVNGGGTYTGTGTMNNTAVQMQGAAAGAITPAATSFSGTAAGVAK